jgi:hypothetical protein
MNSVSITGDSGLVYVRPYGGFPVGYETVSPCGDVKNRPKLSRMLVFPAPPVSFSRKSFDPAATCSGWTRAVARQNFCHRTRVR